MAVLRIDHPDIEAFIKAKDDKTKLNNFNLSIGITDKFMQAIKNKEKTFDLINPKDGKVWKTIDPQYLFNLIIDRAWGSGEPGVLFLDTINKDNPTPELETLQATNPCLTGDTLIFTGDGRYLVPLKQLYEEYTANPNEFNVPVLTWDDKLQRNKLEKINYVVDSGLRWVYEITLDDNTTIEATENHKFLLSNGTKLELKDLNAGDCLMPFHAYTQTTKNRKDLWVNMNNGTQTNYYHLQAEHYFGADINKFGTSRESFVIHHKDGNHSNNLLNNLELKTVSSHNSSHISGDNNPMRKWFSNASEEEKEKYRQTMSKAVSGENNGMYGKEQTAHTKALIGAKNKKNMQDEVVMKKHREGNNRHRASLIKSTLELIKSDNLELTETNYNDYRTKVAKTCPVYNNILKTAILFGYNDVNKFFNFLLTDFNHKIISIKSVGLRHVYDMNINNNHNFAIATNTDKLDTDYSNLHKNNIFSGIITSNCGEIALLSYEACLDKHTLINVGDELYRIEDLCMRWNKGHHDINILTHKDGKDFYSKVGNIKNMGIKPIYRITLADEFYFIDATEDHRVMTQDGWRYVKDLVIDKDELVMSNYLSFTDSTVKSIEYLKDDEVYDIYMPDTECFYANGILVHNCNLGSINLTKMLTEDNKVDYDKLNNTIKLAVRFLDDVIDVCEFPLDKIKEKVKANRKIGLGVMGWADMLYLLKIPYNSQDAYDLAEAVMSYIQTTAHNYSEDLALEKGEFPNFKHSIFKDGNLKRNATMTAIAPTGCQSPNTLVATENGVIRLGELVNESSEQWQELEDVNVQQEFSLTQATKGFVNGDVNTKKILLESGLELECTPNHKYRVIGDNSYEWKCAEDLTTEDCLAVKLGGYRSIVKQPLSQEIDCRYDFGKCKFPKKMTIDLAYFLGYFYGNGSLQENSLTLHFNTSCVDSINNMKAMVLRLFDYDLDKHKGIEVYKDITSLTIKARRLIEFFRVNNLIEDNNVNYSIPLKIRTSGYNVIKSFLDGIGVPFKGRKNNRLVVDIYSKQLAMDIITCARFIGFNVKIKKYLADFEKYYIVPNNLTNVDKLEYCKQLGDEIVYDRVVSVIDSKTMTLDIEVPYNNTYIANSIVSHNTIGMIADCSGGIEPNFALSYSKNVMGGEKFYYNNKWFEEECEKLGFDVEKLQEEISKTGSIQNNSKFLEDTKNLFVTAQDINYESHVLMQSAFQKYTDNSISKTINMSEDATKEDVERVYLLAYDTGCKGVTVFRNNCRADQVLKVDKEEEKPVEVVKTDKLIRDTILEGKTLKIKTACSNLYITVNEQEGELIEVLINHSKAGGCSSNIEGIARLISATLQNKLPLKVIIDQLCGIRCPACLRKNNLGVLSCPDAIGKALINYQDSKKKPKQKVKQVEEIVKEEPIRKVDKTKCPDCGNDLQFSEGCVICNNCGYSKCG